MGRMSLHTKRLKKFNQLGTGEEYIGTLNVTTANVTTANVTTISGVTGDINTFTADVKLVVPTTAYTGANVTEGSIYATGGYLFVGKGGAWKSGAGGLK